LQLPEEKQLKHLTVLQGSFMLAFQDESRNSLKVMLLQKALLSFLRCLPWYLWRDDFRNVSAPEYMNYYHYLYSEKMSHLLIKTQFLS